MSLLGASKALLRRSGILERPLRDQRKTLKGLSAGYRGSIPLGATFVKRARNIPRSFSFCFVGLIA